MSDDDLDWRYLDGTASAGEIARLDAELCRDPAAAERLAHRLRLHERLGQHLGKESASTATRPIPRRRPARPRPRRWSLPLAAAALVFLTVGTLWVLAQPPSGWELDGHALASNQWVDGPGELRRRGEGTVVTLGAGCRLRVPDQGARLELESGEIHCRIAHQNKGSLAIAAPHAEVTVVGTVFSVLVADGRTRCRVEEGRVQFTPHDGKARLLAAGEEAQTGDANPPRITGCRLVDAVSGQPIPGFDPMADECLVDLASLPIRQLNIEVLCTGLAGSLRITYDGSALNNSRGYELHQPWLLAGNRIGGAINPWTPRPGRHVLVAQPFVGTDGRSGPGSPFALTFTVR